MRWSTGHLCGKRQERKEKSLKEAEVEVDGETHKEESAKIQSPKRKVIRVESE